jgi:predicted oxidoreductase
MFMADAVEAGNVRAVGVSNYSAAQLRIAHAALAERGIPLASNQVEYSLLHRAPEVNGLLDACGELGITLIAYQPLAPGVLTGKYRPGDRPKGIRRFGRYFRSDGLKKAQPVVALLGEIGERYSQVSYAGSVAVAHRTGWHPANPGCGEREASGQQCRSAVLHAGCCRDRGARSSDHGLAEVRAITMATATGWQCQEST